MYLSWFRFVAIMAPMIYFVDCIEHVHGPGDTYVRQGETATLHCAFDMHGDDRVFWYRTNPGTILSQNAQVSQGTRPAMGSYSITGDHDNGEYNLQITDVQPGDADEYRCGYEHIGEPDNHVSLGANLHVMVPPSQRYPACLLLTERSVIGQVTRFLCVSTGGNPPATLVWQRNGEDITSPKTLNNELQHVMKAEDVGATFTCIAESIAMHEMRSCSLTPLRRLPSVFVSPRNGLAAVGKSVTFACQKQDKQPSDTYVWYFNQNKVLPNLTPNSRFRLSGDETALTISEITAEDNGASIECKVDNGSAILFGATATVSVSGFVNIENTGPPNASFDNQLSTSHPPTHNGGNRFNLAPPTPRDNNKIALIAVSIIGGFAIASLAAIIYIYLQRKVRRKPRQITIPMTPRSGSTRTVSTRLSSRSFSLRSFRRGSSVKSWRRGREASQPDIQISAPDSYAALSLQLAEAGKHKYQDLKSIGSCSSFNSKCSIPTNGVATCPLPLPPISAQNSTSNMSTFGMGESPTPALLVTCHTNSTDLSEDAESNDSYETIDEKFLKAAGASRPKSRADNKTDSGYLEILG